MNISDECGRASIEVSHEFLSKAEYQPPRFAIPAPTKYRTRYHVAYSCTATSLKHEVEQYLLDGWQLQGGVSVAPVQGAPTERQIFAQALVKLEEL